MKHYFPVIKWVNAMTTTALKSSYKQLNNYLGWKQEERGRFRKATSHMMRKFFNTQLINAGMPEEIREHFMGHKFKDRVRDAYFLASEDRLKKLTNLERFVHQKSLIFDRFTCSIWSM